MKSEDAAHYKICWSVDAESDYIDCSDEIDAQTTSFALVETLQRDTFFYAIQVYNTHGNSSGFTSKVEAPGIPKFLAKNLCVNIENADDQNNVFFNLKADGDGITGDFKSINTLCLEGTVISVDAIRDGKLVPELSVDNIVMDKDHSITLDYGSIQEDNPPIISEGSSITVNMSENNSPTAFNLTLNASDPDTDSLTWSISSPAGNGDATINGTGNSKSVMYSPKTNFSGSDSFVVQVSDGNLTDTIIVSVNINAPENNAPIITEGSSITVDMSENNSPTAFNLTLNASDPDADVLTWSIGSPAGNGYATINGSGNSKSVGYAPNVDFSGTDSFMVQVSDGNLTDTIIVNVNVKAQGGGGGGGSTPVNNSPVITEGSLITISMSENNYPTLFNLTLNATDPDADVLIWSVNSPADNGDAAVNGTGNSKSVMYSPDADFSGTDSFTVQVSDGNLTDMIIVNVNINALGGDGGGSTPVNNSPVIAEGSSITVSMSENNYPTLFNLTLNATDPDAGVLAWSIGSPAENGDAVVGGTGNSKSVRYVSNANFSGTDRFVVQVSDGSLTDTIIVNVNINALGGGGGGSAPVNSSPIIAEGSSITVSMSENNYPTLFNLTLNATDPDADVLTWSIGSPADNGDATINGTGNSKSVRYSPNANFSGTDSFVVQVSDGNFADTIIVNVNINAFFEQEKSGGELEIPVFDEIVTSSSLNSSDRGISGCFISSLIE